MAQQPIHSVVAEFLVDTGWTPEKEVNAVSIINRFSLWCAARELDLLAVGNVDIVTFLDERRAAGKAPATVPADWRMLRAFYRWAALAVDEGGGGELTRGPMRGIKGPNVPTLPSTQAAKPADVRILERSFANHELDRRNAAMVGLMFRSGLRVDELPHLDLGDDQLRPDGYRILRVRITKTDGHASSRSKVERDEFCRGGTRPSGN